MPSSQAIAYAETLLKRRAARRDLVEWARLCGFEPAHHHRVILEHLALVEQGKLKRLLIMCPPGSAKSTYTSLLFVPHYLANNPGHTLLSCSYSYTFIESWGRKCRNLIDLREKELGYGLKTDSRSAGEWETTNNGRYFCAGVNAGIAGHRADLGLIDDFVGNDTDAYSKLYNDQVWDWYNSDFWPRLKPEAAQVIICNHRHYDDLVGRLLKNQPDKWTVLKFPYFAEANDILGRQPGERLWPEWFNEEHAEIVRKHPEYSGLFQQNPTPETGDFFKREWITDNLYDPSDLPDESQLSMYVASDHAVSLRQSADLSCFLPGAVDSNDVLWILPDVYWKRADAMDSVDAMIAMMKRRHPRIWWAEKGHISKSLGPFLTKKQREAGVYTYVEEVTPTKDKKTRAHSIQGRMKSGMVRWPRTAHWLDDAVRQMMEFPMGTHDDFVDALSHLGMGLEKMVKGSRPGVTKEYVPPSLDTLTLSWLKRSDSHHRRMQELALVDN